ncbi:PGPGW domain-containing protein [Nocardioides insulae]|uniref:PGPGW domain-containing protein n=1 Tax=Nocardioides insulae TaxID=394734 RepID=UPI000421F20D|nr:PGPGW domain-containing protein [Nocardioides insulae]
MKRLLLEILGWVLVVAGIGALVLPGPGLLMVFGGLALLSQQYEWAERRLEPIRLRALRTTAQSVANWWTIAFSVSGALIIIGFGLLWTFSPPAPHWWPLAASYWLLGGPWTGVTLLISGAIALALIVYAIRRFRGHPEELAELEEEIDEADEEYHEFHDERERQGAEWRERRRASRDRRPDEEPR